MSDVPEPEAKPAPSPSSLPRRRKRWLLASLMGTVLFAGAALFWLHFDGDNESADSEPSQAAVYPIKHKPEPLKLAIEYHFDRNAIVDSRRVGARLLALSASGNLLGFDGDTFALRGEQVLRRRSTCLGPADQTHAFAGIANGSVVQVAVQDFALQEVTDVPGVPRWIGKRAKDGALVIAYQSGRDAEAGIFIKDTGTGRTYQAAARSIFFLDSADRLWISSAAKLYVVDLARSLRKEIPAKDGWEGVQGFVELLQGQVWAFGGKRGSGERSSFIARLQPDTKPVLLYSAGGKRRPGDGVAPSGPITHILEDAQPGRILVVSHDDVLVSDGSLSTWKPLDALAALGREASALWAVGQAHLAHNGILLTLARGGFMEVTPDFTRRHVLDGQNSVVRPSEIVRLNGGVAFYGDGGPLFYSAGKWHPLPEQVTPPPELMGSARPGETERLWAAMTTIPIEESTSYVIAKAGPPRHYVGHMHGLRDVFLTARWDGKILTVLGREELPIEPDDTFMTPDHQLWNVDDQGLWGFSGGHWHLVTRSAPDSVGAGHGRPSGTAAAAGSAAPLSAKSPIGEPLHFVEAFSPPFYGLPMGVASWSLVRLDSNEAGGIPLIDEVPVKLDGRRLLIRDATIWGNKKEELLLATDQGLGVFNVRWGNCELMRPEGLGSEVSLFMRDGTRRLWLAGRGLWVLRDQKHVDTLLPSIPMLADTEVVALAEAPDGRLVIGSADRGVVFLGVPQGWFQRPAEPPVTTAAWESTHLHEYSFLDRGIVLRPCPGKNDQGGEALSAVLLAGLRELAQSVGPRVRVELEANFEGRPDIAIRGDEPDKLLPGVLSFLEKQGNQTRMSVLKRFGPRGSAAVEVKGCPR